jgi:SpoVK/Ycf46/Vps4 family AAA+-type ATPase
LPEELQHLDKELVKKIQNEIMESGDTITFDDIAGLDDAKQTVQEVVCWPMKRPDLFTGLRRAPNGLLLYGPPGKECSLPVQHVYIPSIQQYQIRASMLIYFLSREYDYSAQVPVRRLLERLLPTKVGLPFSPFRVRR